MRYQPRDRCPMVDFAFWEETIPLWYEQGMPRSVKYEGYDTRETDAFFGQDGLGDWLPISLGLNPGFESKILEDRGDHEVVIDWVGVTTLRKKVMGSIPMHLAHTLVDEESWRREFVPKLQPDSPARLAEDFGDHVAKFNASANVRVLPGASLYGWIRDWMGVEEVSYLVFDEPDLFEEMVETITQISLTVYEKAFAQGVKADACGMWEDMCYSGGPLLPPSVFKRVLVPRYKRITDLLRKNGVEFIWIDCDGKIDELIPLWLEGGVNVMFPIEVGTWGADPVAMRREYGRDLLLMGGVGKRVLAHSKEAITKEVERLAPLVEEGGFIPMPDHRVPPDVPYLYFLHYLKEARRVWGRETNLRPAPALEFI